MTNNPLDKREWFCPYLHETIPASQCYDVYLIACGLFEDDELVPPQDRDRLLQICEACGKCFD